MASATRDEGNAPALPWGAPAQQHTHTAEPEACLATEPEATSVAVGHRIEVLWELETEEGSEATVLLLLACCRLRCICPSLLP